MTRSKLVFQFWWTVGQPVKSAFQPRSFLFAFLCFFRFLKVETLPRKVFQFKECRTSVTCFVKVPFYTFQKQRNINSKNLYFQGVGTQMVERETGSLDSRPLHFSFQSDTIRDGGILFFSNFITSQHTDHDNFLISLFKTAPNSNVKMRLVAR